MTYDTTPLERDCVLLNCSLPAVDPGRNRVHCAKHDPNPVPVGIIGQDPDTQEPRPVPAPATPPPPLDPAAMEPYWNGSEWVLRPKRTLAPHVDRQELVDLLHRLTAAVTAVERWLE
jgi:hypothetical protein